MAVTLPYTAIVLPEKGDDSLSSVWGDRVINAIQTNEKRVHERQAAYTLPLYKGAGTYRLVTANYIPSDIVSLLYQADAGTCTITAVQIDGTNITGLTALSVTTSEATATATAAKALGSGGNLDIVVASVVSATELYLNFKVNQTADRA